MYGERNVALPYILYGSATLHPRSLRCECADANATDAPLFPRLHPRACPSFSFPLLSHKSSVAFYIRSLFVAISVG